MIKIIKDGQKEFTARCNTCGCEFSYQLIDITLGSVTCPCCGGYVAHKLGEDSYDTLITKNTSADVFNSIQIIHDLCIDYDDFNTVEGLKSLIGDIRIITEETLK